MLFGSGVSIITTPIAQKALTKNCSMCMNTNYWWVRALAEANNMNIIILWAPKQPSSINLHTKRRPENITQFHFQIFCLPRASDEINNSRRQRGLICFAFACSCKLKWPVKREQTKMNGRRTPPPNAAWALNFRQSVKALWSKQGAMNTAEPNQARTH